jgi:ribonuclease T2
MNAQSASCRLIRYAGVFPWLLAVAILLTASNSTIANPPQDARGGAQGAYDYFALALAWAPTLCLESPGSEECSWRHHGGFVVEGLWPQKDFDSPVNCTLQRPLTDALINSMLDLMASPARVTQEWLRHGTCSGLEPAAYFALMRKVYESVALPDLSSIANDTSQSTQTITNAFRHLDHGLPPQAVIVSCSMLDAPRLREVFICVDARYLGSFYCKGELLRRTCKSLTLLVSPIR